MTARHRGVIFTVAAAPDAVVIHEAMSAIVTLRGGCTAVAPSLRLEDTKASMFTSV